jgi:hypothetical protein
MGFLPDQPLVSVTDSDSESLGLLYRAKENNFKLCVSDVNATFKYLLYCMIKSSQFTLNNYYRKLRTALLKLINYELCSGNYLRIITHLSSNESDNKITLKYAEIFKSYFLLLENEIKRRERICDSIFDDGAHIVRKNEEKYKQITNARKKNKK